MFFNDKRDNPPRRDKKSQPIKSKGISIFERQIKKLFAFVFGSPKDVEPEKKSDNNIKNE
jgi:hypothetical protein